MEKLDTTLPIYVTPPNFRKATYNGDSRSYLVCDYTRFVTHTEMDIFSKKSPDEFIQSMQNIAYGRAKQIGGSWFKPIGSDLVVSFPNQDIFSLCNKINSLMKAAECVEKSTDSTCYKTMDIALISATMGYEIESVEFKYLTDMQRIELCAKMAHDFYEQYRHVSDWEIFLADKDASDWHEFVVSFMKNKLNHN